MMLPIYKWRTFVFAGCFILSCLVLCILALLTGFLSSKIGHWWAACYGKWVNRCLSLICHIRVEVKGIASLPKQPYIILSNHQSAWETFVFQSYFYPLVSVMKKELLTIPIFGWAVRLIHPIVLDRKQKRRSFIQVISQGKAALEQKYNLLLFPEGTRSTPPAIGKFSRSGISLACAMGCPIILVAHNAGLFWPAKSWPQYSGTILVSYSEPIATEGRTVDEVYQEVVAWMREEISSLCHFTI